MQRLGYTWDAVGAYNAASPDLRRAYTDKVRRHLPSHTPEPTASRSRTLDRDLSATRTRDQPSRLIASNR